MTIRLRIWLAAMFGAVLLLAGLGGVLAALGEVPGAFVPGAAVVLALFAPLAWLLAILAYAPVRDVTKTARSIISTGQLDRRCFYGGPHDDVGRLVVVVNDLLVRYDAALGALQRLRAAAPTCDCPRATPAIEPADLVLDLAPGAPEQVSRPGS